MPRENEKQAFRLRQQLIQDQTVGDLARDTQKIFDLINPVSYKKFRSFYTEPMTLGVFSEPPLCVELVRVTQVIQAEAPARTGGMVHYVYKPQKGGCIITSIDGFTPTNPRTEYDFVFRVTFAAGQAATNG